jgi:hypothetical protein
MSCPVREMSSATGHASGGPPLPPWPAALIRVWAPCGPRVSDRGGRPAQVVRLGARLAPGARPVTTAVRLRGRAAARRVRWGRLVPRLGSPGAALGLGAADPGARRAGRQSRATGGAREAGRSAPPPVSRGVGRQGGSRRLWGPGPGRRRVGAWPGLTAGI